MTTAPTAPTTLDPMDAAMTPSESSSTRTSFGQLVTVDARFVKLVKGQGKVAFDDTYDDPGLRRTAIALRVEVTKRDGDVFPLDQDVLDFSKEWKDYTLPSILKLGTTLRLLKDKYVQVQRVPTGEKYTNRSGEERDRTAIVFIAAYDSLADMKQASDVFWNARSSSQTDAQPAAAPPTPTGDSSGVEREFAKQGLTMLHAASGGDYQVFCAALAQNPLVGKHFGPESDEVKALFPQLPF